MSSVSIQGNASGTGIFTIASPNSNTNRTLTLPDNTGTILTSATTTGFPAGSVLQVVSASKTDTFTTSSTSFVDITGLTVSITPTSATSKILILAQVSYSGSNGGGAHFRLSGGNSGNYVGAASGSRVQAIIGGYWISNLTNTLFSAPFNYLDSPATTSPITYSVQTRKINTGSNPSQINWSIDDSNTGDTARGASSITLMEIAA